MRGKHCKRPKNTENYRITPADAGKTMCGDCSDLAVGDHPRGCGENITDAQTGYSRQGSPPRMRGKHATDELTPEEIRITPADAGKTHLRIVPKHIAWDHPRGCGENETARASGKSTWGSPPRMRGKPTSYAQAGKYTRITPADAGKTHVCLHVR